MITANLIPQISEWLADSNVDKLELQGPDISISLDRRNHPISGDFYGTLSAPLLKNNLSVICAHHAGIFYDRHPLREEPLAEPDVKINAGDHVGYLRLGLLISPIVAPRDGYVAYVTHNNAVVGYATRLLEIEPPSLQAID